MKYKVVVPNSEIESIILAHITKSAAPYEDYRNIKFVWSYTKDEATVEYEK